VGKTLLHRLFGIGRIPGDLRAMLEAEGLLAFDEGIGGWIVTRNFRAPGKRSNFRMSGFTGFLAVTERRVIAHAYGRRILNVPYDDPSFAALRVDLARPDRIEISFDAGTFHPDWSGGIVLRFNTAMAGTFFDILGVRLVERD